jgi:sugar-specific transcriptional regulator TrmB
MNTASTLKRAGLTQKESKVYLASLELGPASISQIAKRARLKRPTVYLVINDLMKRNLIIKIPKGKRLLYHVENPEKITTNLRERLVELEKTVPGLVALYQNSPQKAKVRFYEGREEIKKLFWEAATSGSKNFICCFSHKSYSRLLTKKENEDLYNFLERKRAKIDDIVEESPGSREYAREKIRRRIGQTKFLPKNFPLKTDCFVWESKVALISYPSQSAVLIEDRDIADTQRNLLKFMWKHL